MASFQTGIQEVSFALFSLEYCCRFSLNLHKNDLMHCKDTVLYCQGPYDMGCGVTAGIRGC